MNTPTFFLNNEVKNIVEDKIMRIYLKALILKETIK